MLPLIEYNFRIEPVQSLVAGVPLLTGNAEEDTCCVTQAAKQPRPSQGGGAGRGFCLVCCSVAFQDEDI